MYHDSELQTSCKNEIEANEKLIRHQNDDNKFISTLAADQKVLKKMLKD